MYEQSIDQKEIKLIELDILKYIDKVCTENNLRYYLAGGTLLGAIRHKGFIPWDDDVDISMPRPDYERFIEIMKEDNSVYRCLSSYDEDYPYAFVKVINTKTKIIETTEKLLQSDSIGVFVDIFPIDAMGNSRAMAKLRLKLFRLFKILIMYASFSDTEGRNTNPLIKAIRKTFIHVLKKINKKRLYSWIIRFINKKEYDSSRYIASAIAGQAGKRELISYKAFAEVEYIEFEDDKFPAPIGWDEYLKNLYNDYMKLPPVEKRHTDHSFQAFWLK